MAEEARLEETEHGTVPTSEGWFAVHATEVPWMRSRRFGAGCRFEGPVRFSQTGVNLRVLDPGEPACLYHRENAQEDFFVLTGECTLLVEGEERRLRAGHFVHCPPGTDHVFVGAGDGPCAILMVGHRPEVEELCYPVDERAARYGASVTAETTDQREAYGEIEIEQIEPLWPLPGAD